MFTRQILFIAAIVVFSNCIHAQEVINGHAHNDYEHINPLYDAIENGFMSVEADVHLVNDNLFVSHDLPEELNPNLTLEELYLKPLRDIIKRNKGSVYQNYSGPFYLFIDFKTQANPSYEKLKKILSGYLPIISVIKGGGEQVGAVTILITGNRPVNEILKDEPKLVRIDGRPGDLNKNIPATIMPVISDNYSNYISWNGEGIISEKELSKLVELVETTHDQNRKLRLWASPDNENVWGFLLENGIDLVNTDHLEKFRAYHSSLQHPSDP